MKINHLPSSQGRRRAVRQRNLRSFQSITLPEDRPFELDEVLRLRGVINPTYGQYTYLRHQLTDAGYILHYISGRHEWWTKNTNFSRNEQIDKGRYTPQSFLAKFFPNIKIHNRDEEWQAEKIMRAWGYRPRGNYEKRYWSMKVVRRMPLPQPRPQADKPKYVKIPPGSFNLLDFLERNKMRRFPQNFEWAKKYLDQHGIKRLHGSHRYAKRDQRGNLPASVTGLWQLPGPAFTTYQFQELNNAKKPSMEEWSKAVEFLKHSGYEYDPNWKRWIKKT